MKTIGSLLWTLIAIGFFASFMGNSFGLWFMAFIVSTFLTGFGIKADNILIIIIGAIASFFVIVAAVILVGNGIG